MQTVFSTSSFLDEDQITTIAEDSQDKNGSSMTEQKSLLGDEKTEVRIRKQSN